MFRRGAIAAATVLFYSFVGFDAMTTVAEEVYSFYSFSRDKMFLIVD